MIKNEQSLANKTHKTSATRSNPRLSILNQGDIMHVIAKSQSKVAGWQAKKETKLIGTPVSTTGQEWLVGLGQKGKSYIGFEPLAVHEASF